MISFTISLFVRKNRFLVIALPNVLFLVVMFGSSFLGLPTMNLPKIMTPDISGYLPPLATPLYAGIFLLINLLPLLYKVFVAKDEL